LAALVVLADFRVALAEVRAGLLLRVAVFLDEAGLRADLRAAVLRADAFGAVAFRVPFFFDLLARPVRAAALRAAFRLAITDPRGLFCLP
jgi:hypothetical protein